MKTLTFLLLFMVGFSALAQKSDSTHTHYRIIRGGMIEHSTELKSKRYVKNGDAEIKLGRLVIAAGLYKDDKRYGRWRFFKGPDSLEQIYNYTTKKLEYNNTMPNIYCIVDSAVEGDKIKKCAKIGGFLSSLRLLVKEFSPSKKFKNYPGVHRVLLIFHIDKSGKLIKFESETGEAELKLTENIELANLRPEDFEFTPAELNGRPIASKLIFESKLTVN